MIRLARPVEFVHAFGLLIALAGLPVGVAWWAHAIIVAVIVYLAARGVGL